MRKIKTETNLWQYLEMRGVLSGTDAEIKAAKHEFWRLRRAQLRRIERQQKREYNIALSHKSGEYGKIALAARKHKMPVTVFIRTAALAYLDRSYICPNPEQVARIEQLLMECLNEIKVITSRKDKYHYEREQKLDQIAERIAQLETEIRQALVFPPEKQ